MRVDSPPAVDDDDDEDDDIVLFLCLREWMRKNGMNKKEGRSGE